jgi:hypothetical protein
MNPLLSELDVTEMLIDDMKKLIHEQITRKLLKVVEALQNLYGSSTQNQIHRNGRVSSTIHAENAFPIQAGNKRLRTVIVILLSNISVCGSRLSSKIIVTCVGVCENGHPRIGA